MFKKFFSSVTTFTLILVGISVISAPVSMAANLTPTLTVTAAPLSGMPVTNVYWRSSDNLNLEFSVGTPTWSPSVVSSFAANTVYQATVVVTPNNPYTMPSVNANSFGLAGAGASGATVAHSAISAGAASVTLVITFPDSGSGGGGGGSSTCSSDLLSSSSTIKGVNFTKGIRQAHDTDFNGGGSSFMGSVVLTSAQASGTGTTLFTATGGATARWLYVSPSVTMFGESDISTQADLANVTLINNRFISVKVSGSGCTDFYRIKILVAGGSSPSTPTLTAEQIAAAAATAAKAAAQAAAEVRAAQVNAAQDKLSTTLKGDKPGTLDDYRSANINVTTAAAVTRLNAEVLKLSAADRGDFAKIKAIADKIEFDESFFNATVRPTVATYNTYGVTVTDRTVATISAKVLELPVAKRADITAIAEIAKVENFVDRVANPETRVSVSATTLISNNLLPAESPYKYSVVKGLANYPEGSLNTMAKIEAAIKAEIAKAEAPKLRLAAIKAKIAARNK